jgi:hypothetical protein
MKKNKKVKYKTYKGYILKKKSTFRHYTYFCGMNITRQSITDVLARKGYKYFDSGKDYNLNIVAVRNNIPGSSVTNVFDDWITVSYKVDGVWQMHVWPVTTDPGKAPMLLGNNGRGVARLVPGQYPGSHMVRKHQGKYEALCQKGHLRLYRDSNKDLKYDDSNVVDSYSDGINIHKAGRDSTWVDHWSHGCTVFKRVKDFDAFMVVVKKAAAIHGNSFTYTLIDSKDLSL